MKGFMACDSKAHLRSWKGAIGQAPNTRKSLVKGKATTGAWIEPALLAGLITSKCSRRSDTKEGVEVVVVVCVYPQASNTIKCALT